ncbi:MAG: hypothetical protein ACRCXT_18260 [Paraclostridium sp.]
MRAPSFNYVLHDKTRKPALPKQEIAQPLFFMAVSSDKGDERMRITNEDDFFNSYVLDKKTIFQKHGQPLLQAANIVSNGGKILIKRVVAEDATLANVTVLAKVISESAQKTDKNGNLLYTDAVTGAETIESIGNEPVMIDVTSIQYQFKQLENHKDLKGIAVDIENYAEAEGLYPLFTISDIGRGQSIKKFMITPDYKESKYKDCMRYTISILENNKVIEVVQFTLDPDIVETNQNKSLGSMLNTFSKQVSCKSYDDSILDFFDKIAELSGNTVQYCKTHDVLFGNEKKGSPTLNNIQVDLSDESNLSYVYGIELLHGTNGAFGDKPIDTEEYKTQLVNFFNGTTDKSIYDLDNHKLDLIVDSNYPKEVKREIEKLVEFRRDLFYARDVNLGCNTIEDIMAAHAEASKSIYSGTYGVSYDIKDPYTRKQIPVTIGYTLSRLLINHFKFGRANVPAGETNNMILSDAIEGTVNFVPIITPGYDQKEMLAENNINYASYFDGKLIVETAYTSQEDFTELSFINNVITTQEVIKDLRTYCPKSRYKFIEGEDLDKYKDAVEERLAKYRHNFSSLKFVYLNDETMIANKVFYAAIEVVYKPFTQAELFDFYALTKEDTTTR